MDDCDDCTRKHIYVHPEAARDLIALKKGGYRVAAAYIYTLIEQINADEDLFEHLTEHGFGVEGVDLFNISVWSEAWNQNQNLWRLKAWDLKDHDAYHLRIIYAYFPKYDCIYVLGIVPRSFNYALKHPLSRRITDTYRDLLECYG